MLGTTFATGITPSKPPPVIRHHSTMPADLSPETEKWHLLLKSVSIFNLLLWLATASLAPIHTPAARAHRALSAIYAAVCAFRSFYPRVDLERIVLVDHWLSNIALGRTSATIAEMAFIIQCGLSLKGLAETTGVSNAETIGFIIVPIIFIAQCCCWLGVLTTNHLYHALEESLWTIMIALVGAALVEIWPHTSGMTIAYFLPLALLGCVLGFYVIAFCDVPMYVERYREGNSNGTNKFMSIREGMKDSSTKMVATGDWKTWKHEVGWMTPYFSLGVWLSIAMVWLHTHD